jgi:hypothetical protein
MSNFRAKGKRSFIAPEIREEIEQLVGESLRGSLDNVFHGLNFVRTMLSKLSQQELKGKQLIEFLTYLNIETSRIINMHSKEVNKEILDAVERYAIRESKMKQTDVQEQPGINLNVRRGEEAKASFIIANSSQEEMEVAFVTTDLINEDGHIAPSAVVQFSPETLKLAPSHDATIGVAVKTNQRFRVDKIYSGRILLPKHPNKEIPITLHIARASRSRPPGIDESKAPKPTK